MPNKRGPKTHASKGLRPKVQINVSMPAELHDQIIELVGKLADSRSAVITELLKKALDAKYVENIHRED